MCCTVTLEYKAFCQTLRVLTGLVLFSGWKHNRKKCKDFIFFNNLAKCVTLPKRVANGTISPATACTWQNCHKCLETRLSFCRWGCPVLKKWSFLGTKGEAIGTVSNLVTAREKQTESQTDLVAENSRYKAELTCEGHAPCKVLFFKGCQAVEV